MEKNEDGMTTKKMKRRDFLDYFIAGGAFCLTAGVAAPIVKFLLPPMKESGGAKEVRAAGVSELAVGDAKTFDLNGKAAMVIHMPAGFFAVSAVCTHLGCIVKWDHAKQQIVCPCHGGAFDYKGNIAGGPPPKPLPAYTTTVRGGDVMVSGGG